MFRVRGRVVLLCKLTDQTSQKGFSSKVLLGEITHLWVKHDVNSISCFFCKKKLMAALLRFFEINLGDKIFHCVFNGTFWCRNSPLLLHRTVILEISERLKAVRMNNCFFDCWISNKNPVARMHSKKQLVPWLNTTYFQLSLEKKIKFQKAFVRILQLISSPSLMWTEHRDVL